MLDGVSQLGFGSYRVTSGNPIHGAALARALDLGCTLVDTACNYGDGRSEELIGEVLTCHPRGVNAFVISKVGYVTESAATRLVAAGIDFEGLDAISEESKYSLDIDVIRVELTATRERLQRKRLDAILLHNPEHYFDLEGRQDRRRETIRRVFEFFEERVAAGELTCYGVSSNVIATHAAISIEEWIDIARSVAMNHSFRLVEFPFNLLETEAARGDKGGSFIERIRALGLRSIGNRPLSSQRPMGPVRFATLDKEDSVRDDSFAYATCVELVEQRLKAAGLPHMPMDFMVLQFLRDNRRGISHPDLVDAIFQRHVYPFVEQLWLDETSADGPRAFAELHAILRQHALWKLSDQAELIRSELVATGTIGAGDPRSLALIACDFGLRSGLDHVVVGMRKPEHVDTLRTLLPRGGS